MSLIFGFRLSDGAERADLPVHEMYKGIALYPYEKHSNQIKGGVGFSQVLTYNTPEARHENSPVFIDDRKVLFTSQGRIDNRAELATLLKISSYSHLSDGFFILQSFLRWGKECVHYLKGDWSFAVYNFVEQELFLARDPIGNTALYYYKDKFGFYFSSSIKSILSLTNYEKQLNELYFIKLLTTWNIREKPSGETIYKNIFSIPQGHHLSFKDGDIHLKKYWNPQQKPVRRYKNKQRYADEMFEILTTAVKSKLRTETGVVAQLSGGLDSSTVGYIAAELLKKENKVLTTFSHVPFYTREIQNDILGHNRILNERPLIEAIASASGNINPIFLDSANYSIIKGIKNFLKVYDSPLHSATNLFWGQDLMENAKQKGFSTMLGGDGGNGTISFAGIDYLLPFSLSTFIRHPLHFARNQIAKPIAYRYFNKTLNNMKGSLANLEKIVQGVFATNSILEAYDILNDIRINKKVLYKFIDNINDQKQNFVDLYSLRGLYGAASNHYFGVEYRDPTVDINVLEYFFGIPNEVFFDNDYNNRMLVKKMMKGKIPDHVLFEKKKGLQSSDIVYRAKAQAGEISAYLKMASKSDAVNHYIDTRSLTEEWESFLTNQHLNAYQIQPLLKALKFAIFLQQNFD